MTVALGIASSALVMTSMTAVWPSRLASIPRRSAEPTSSGFYDYRQRRESFQTEKVPAPQVDVLARNGGPCEIETPRVPPKAEKVGIKPLADEKPARRG